MCRDARGQLVKSPLGLLCIASPRAVRRIRADPLPKHERQLARQARASALDHRIESSLPALPLELGWV
jgi:hypothetical protein